MKLIWRLFIHTGALREAQTGTRDMQSIQGVEEVHILRTIVDLAESENSERAHALLRVWRALSTKDRQVAEAVAKLSSVADDVRWPFDDQPRRLDFYVSVLQVSVRRLTVLINAEGEGFDDAMAAQCFATMWLKMWQKTELRQLRPKRRRRKM